MLTARLRDIQVAEDALQEVIVSALADWDSSATPSNPKGGLYRVALNKAIELKRRHTMAQSKQAQIIIHTELDHPANTGDPSANGAVFDSEPLIPDERLRMIFTCGHPAIKLSAQFALTLRTLCGLKTSEIARAFFVAEKTIAQRLVRTKCKMRDAGIPYEVPARCERHKRLHSALGVIYPIFNEGYSASQGDDPIRADLCNEAIYLVKCLQQLLLQHAEVHGLAALLCLHDARRQARTDADGRLVMLAEQDRLQWDEKKIREGFGFLVQASQLRQNGPYQLQAAE